MNPEIDAYINRSDRWQKEISELRTIVLDCNLAEERKWGVPCYTFRKANIVLIHVFKEYCALLFFKGALLKDTDGVLVQQTNNTQASRQIRFSNVQEITRMEAILKQYIHQAIEIEKSGLKVHFKKTTEFTVPEEFQKKLDELPALQTAFHALTPGRQRAYLLHFSQPKQSKTRAARVDKYLQHILNGKGLEVELTVDS